MIRTIKPFLKPFALGNLKPKFLPPLFLAVFFLLSMQVNAQETSDEKVTKIMNEADRRFGRGDFQRAGKLYVQVAQADSTHALALFKAGISYLYNGMPRKGLSFIQHSRVIDPDVNSYFYFWLGRGYHLNFKMDSAVYYYRKFVKLNRKRNSAYKTEAQKYIEQAHRGRSFFITVENTPYRLENLGEKVNSNYTERNPVFSHDGNTMFFTSRRPLNEDEKVLDDGEFYERVYYSYRKIDGSWTEAVPIFPKESANSHLICLQLIENDSKLLLYRPSSSGTGEVLFSENHDEKWTEPKPYNTGLSASCFSINAYISPDMQHFYYATFPNKGNLDILEASRKKGKSWSSAVSLPDYINTSDDETSPHLTADFQTLYFSSKGHQGLGGFDLYKSTWDASANKWSAPQNVGYPINTPGDELDYSEIMEFGQKIGILSAERTNGYGKTDIYKVLPSNYTELSGVVTDSKGNVLPDINVIIRDKYNVIYDLVKTDTVGVYHSRNVLAGQSYDVVVMNEKQMLKTSAVEIPVEATIAKPVIQNFSIDLSKKALQAANAAYKFSLDTLPEAAAVVMPKVATKRNTDTSITTVTAHDQEMVAIEEKASEKAAKTEQTTSTSEAQATTNVTSESENTSAPIPQQTIRTTPASSQATRTAAPAPARIIMSDEQVKQIQASLKDAEISQTNEEKALEERIAREKAEREKLAMEAAKKAKADSILKANESKVAVVTFESKRGSKGNGTPVKIAMVASADTTPDVEPTPAPKPKAIASSKKLKYFDETELVTSISLNDPQVIWVKKAKVKFHGRKALGSFHIYFDKNKYNIDPEDEAHLKKIMKASKHHKTQIAQIIGFTDPHGDLEHNMKLSAKRAKAVIKYLKKLGMKTEYFAAAGKGPIGDTESHQDEEARQKARKVLITLYEE